MRGRDPPGERQRRRRDRAGGASGRAAPRHGEGICRIGDAVEQQRSHGLAAPTDPIAGQQAHDVADQDLAVAGLALQAGGDHDREARAVVVLPCDVAGGDADAQGTVRRGRGELLGEGRSGERSRDGVERGDCLVAGDGGAAAVASDGVHEHPVVGGREPSRRPGAQDGERGRRTTSDRTRHGAPPPTSEWSDLTIDGPEPFQVRDSPERPDLVMTGWREIRTVSDDGDDALSAGPGGQRRRRAGRANVGLYVIERNFAEQLDPELLDHEGIKLVNDDVGVRWIYSFLSADRKKSYCLYEAPSAEAIREAAVRAGMPADVIVSVEQIVPPSFVS